MEMDALYQHVKNPRTENLVYFVQLLSVNVLTYFLL